MKANIEKAIDNFYLEQERFEHYYDELDIEHTGFEPDFDNDYDEYVARNYYGT